MKNAEVTMQASLVLSVYLLQQDSESNNTIVFFSINKNIICSVDLNCLYILKCH